MTELECAVPTVLDVDRASRIHSYPTRPVLQCGGDLSFEERWRNRIDVGTPGKMHGPRIFPFDLLTQQARTDACGNILRRLNHPNSHSQILSQSSVFREGRLETAVHAARDWLCDSSSDW